MISPKVLQLIALADEFEQKTQVAPDLNSPNRKYQVQREMLGKFYDSFRSQLRSVLGQMEADLATLRERGFDKSMWRLFGKLYQHISTIYAHLKEDKPYLAARELVELVESRHQRAVIDNLEFLAKHHLEKTAPETAAPLPPQMRHILEAESLGMLKELADGAKKHMEQNPLIVEPITTPPPGRGENPAAQHPDQPIGPEALTKG